MERQRLDIPAQAAESSLNKLADTFDHSLLYSRADLAGIVLNPVKGYYSLPVALGLLCENTPLDAVVTDKRVIVVSIAQVDRQQSESEPMTKSPRGLLAALMSLFLLTDGEMTAAQQAATKTKPVMEEILVTANKRGEQRLIDVPVSISVLGEESIRTMGLQNIGDLAQVVPGLSSFESVGTPGQQKITMRGIGVDSGQRASVGYYWDEMPANFLGTSPDGTTLDAARVEVLRGPQGTLFGEGSMGGTVRIISNKPDLESFGGEIEAGASSIKDGDRGWNVKAVLNLPIVEDVFGIRIAGEVRNDPGFIDNIQLNTKDFNDRELEQLRLRGLWRITDDASLAFTYYRYDNDVGGPTIADDLDALTVSTFKDVSAYSTLDAFNAVISVDFDFANLVSSTTYTDRLQNQPAAFGDGITFLQAVDVDTGGEDFSQEIRLVSTGEGPLTWTIGGFYSQTEPTSDLSLQVIALLPGLGALLGFPAGSDLQIQVETENSLDAEINSWAAFGEVSYDITEDLTATLGLRYYDSDYDWVVDENRASTTRILLDGVPIFELPSVVSSVNRPVGSDDAVSPKINLSYALAEDALVYVNAAKGFRAGGVNLIRDVPTPDGGSVQLPQSYGPESLWTYELGTKAILGDGRWMIEGAVFYTDWSDLQSVFFPFEGATAGGTTNQGNATVKGVEAAVVYRPSEALSFTLNTTYTDASFDDATAEHGKGDPVPFVPEVTWSLSFDWRPELTGDMNALVHIDYSHQDEIFRTGDATLGTLLQSDDFNWLNARLGVEQGSWSAYLYGKNLANEEGRVNPVDPSSVGAIVPLRPRTVGLEFRLTF